MRGVIRGVDYTTIISISRSRKLVSQYNVTIRYRYNGTKKITMRSAKTTARLTQRNIFKSNISAGQTSLLQV